MVWILIHPQQDMATRSRDVLTAGRSVLGAALLGSAARRIRHVVHRRPCVSPLPRKEEAGRRVLSVCSFVRWVEGSDRGGMSCPFLEIALPQRRIFRRRRGHGHSTAQRLNGDRFCLSPDEQPRFFHMNLANRPTVSMGSGMKR